MQFMFRLQIETNAVNLKQSVIIGGFINPDNDMIMAWNASGFKIIFSLIHININVTGVKPRTKLRLNLWRSVYIPFHQQISLTLINYPPPQTKEETKTKATKEGLYNKHKPMT